MLHALRRVRARLLAAGDTKRYFRYAFGEIEIVALLSERMRDKEIAALLSISPETVKTHLRNIYGKLEAHDRRQAVDRAIEVGILRPRG